MPEVFENIISFFEDLFTPGPTKMNYWSFYKSISKWSHEKYYPTKTTLPDIIELPESFWKEVINVYRETKIDSRERAISVFWGDGELLVSSLTKGNETSVTPQGNVKIQYLPTNRREYFSKEVYIDNKLRSKYEVYYKKMPEKIIVEHLFNMHSHPPHENEKWLNNDQSRIQKESYGNLYIGKQTYYSFFSLQDIKALFSSNNVITGLVTDRLWLIFRTSESINKSDLFSDSDVNINTLQNEFNLVIYQGELGRKLIKIN